MESSSSHLENSPTKNCLLSSNLQSKTNEPYSSNGWTFEENKIFEDCFADFDAKDCPEFFAEVARSLPKKSMSSLRAHYHELMEDFDLIEKLYSDYMEDANTEDVAVVEQPVEEHNVSRRPKKPADPWTIHEQELFLLGLEAYGKGQWKKIAEEYVPTRTPAQVASHAQKFMKRMDCKTPHTKRRITINDITKVEDCKMPLHPEINPQTLGNFGAPDLLQMHRNYNYPFWFDNGGSSSRT